MAKPPPFDPSGFAEALCHDAEVRSRDGCFWQWSGTHWIRLSDEDVLRTAMTWVCHVESTARSATKAKSAMDTALLILPKLPYPKEIIGSRIVIPCRNAYLSLEDDGGLLEGKVDRELGFTWCIECDFDIFSPAPVLFSGFLDWAHSGDADVITRLQEHVGYTFLPDNRYQRCSFHRGSGANGKGTMLRLVQALHGPGARALDVTCLSGFATATSVIGASLLFHDDLPDKYLDEGPFKTLVSGDALLMRELHKAGVTYANTAKIWVNSNQRYKTRDKSEGVERRIDEFIWGNQVTGDGVAPLLEQKILANELPGVLNWAIAGLIRLQQRGRFAELPIKMMEAKSQARTEADSVRYWWDDTDRSLLPEANSPKARVYREYAEFAKGSGLCPCSAIEFRKRMQGCHGANLIERKSGGERLWNVSLSSI